MSSILDEAAVELSVVIPVYGCEGSLSQLHERLERTLSVLTPSWEIVFVDDRSPDESWTTLARLAATRPNVRAVRLSRNFGQHAAITAGLAESTGRWTVVMDCDLQDRPEDIPRLYEAARDGYDIVFGRRQRRNDSWFRRLGARAYFGLLNRVLGTSITREYGTFSIISAQVRRAFLSLHDADRHYLFILYWLGFRHSTVEVARDPRHEGRSSYTFSTLVKHALAGVFFQTTVLLRWIVYLGFALSMAGVLLAAFFLYVYVAETPYPGWTSLAVLLLLIGGFIIMSTGVAGLYIGKIFEQAKGRPLYVVDERVEATEGQEREPRPAEIGTGAPPAS
jgi:glycosyltransferase involved in cell wall biosynthesis